MGAVEPKSKFLRVPKRVRFPFGYTVKVVQKTLAELEKDCGSPVYGYWDGDTRTIYIGKDLPAAKRRYALLHELRHAWVDFEHLYAEAGIVQV